MSERTIVALIRQQEEDLSRHRISCLSAKHFLTSARPTRLPSMDVIMVADGDIDAFSQSAKQRLGGGEMLLQHPSALKPLQSSSAKDTHQVAKSPTSVWKVSTPQCPGAGVLQSIPSSPDTNGSRALSRSSSAAAHCTTPDPKADSRREELQAFFQKVVAKLDADPSASVQGAMRQLLDQTMSFPNHSPIHIPSALPLVSSLCLLQYSCQPHSPLSFESAVLVLDICQYSRLTAALAHLGPHILNRCVNACLSPMIDHILSSGGDVIKFAGDAIVAVWTNSRLAESVQQAVACAAWLQEHCGHSPVSGTDQTLQIHIGVACGPLQSEILYSHCPDFENLHFVSGLPLEEADEAAEAAKATQVCLTAQCTTLCPSIESTPTARPGICLLQGLHSTSPVEPLLSYEKPYNLVPGFVPPAILQWLQQGRELRSMEANRMLTVMFIYCNEQANVSKWVATAQAVLKRHQCVILQAIHDDKGIHVVAAFNVYQTFADSGDRSVAVARELSGCTVGVAHGMVFCGLTGNSHASRWDITGFACVRACRLMQQALRMQLPALFDASVLSTLSDPEVLEELPQPFNLKGSANPVTGFIPRPTNPTLSLSLIPPPPNLSTACPIRQSVLDSMLSHLDRSSGCSTCVVHGVRGSGKRWLCLSALASRAFHVIEHVAHPNETQLSILRTVAAWGDAHQEALGGSPCQLLEALQQQQVHTAFREGIEMLRRAVAGGLRVALLVRCAQFLDDTSLRFLTEVARGAPPDAPGRFAQCLTHYPAAGMERVDTLFCQLPNVQYFPLGALDAAQTAQMVEHHLGHAASAPLLAAIQAQTAGHLESVVAVCKFLRGELDALRGEPEDLRVPAEWSWPATSPVITLKMFHLFDLLPHLQQRMLKVIASISAQPNITAYLPSVMEVTASLLDLDPANTTEAVRELETLGLITLCPHRCTAHKGGEELNSALCFCPALKEAVLEALLPEEQCRINSVAARVFSMWHPMDHPLQFLVRSRHHRIAGESVECRKDLHAALKLLKSGSFANSGTILADINKDLEIIGGLGPAGMRQTVASPRLLMALELPPQPLALSGLRQFQPPMELGPLGWLVHSIGQAVLALYNSQSRGIDDSDLGDEMAQLKEALLKYAQALRRVTSAIGMDAHLPAAVAQWTGQHARWGFAATVELAQALFAHLQELTDLAQHCVAWASYAAIADLDPMNVALRSLQQHDVAMAVLAMDLVPVPAGPEGEAFTAFLHQVKRQCVSAASGGPQSPNANLRIFHVFRSFLAVRALLSTKDVPVGNGAPAFPAATPLAPSRCL